MQTLPSILSCPESTAVDSGVISVFVTNLSKYNIGELVGKWLRLPTTPEQVEQCFEQIGINNIHNEEIFLTDYESAVQGISSYISEYSSLDELNYLAYKLAELDNDQTEIYEAIIGIEGHVQSIGDLINLTDNLDCFQCLSNVSDEYDLGYYWIEESGCYNLEGLGNLANYFDYEKYGNDIALEQSGAFSSCGYVYHTGERFNESYDGQEVPDEYCVVTCSYH